MEKQELQAIQELVEYMRRWCHDNHSFKQSQSFGQVLRIVNLQAVMIDELTKHGGYNPTPMTIEEKVANAVFYIDSDNTRYQIYSYNLKDGYFCITDNYHSKLVHFNSVSADALFLGTIIL